MKQSVSLCDFCNEASDYLSLKRFAFTMLSPCLPFKKARRALKFSFYEHVRDIHVCIENVCRVSLSKVTVQSIRRVLYIQKRGGGEGKV